MSDPVPQIRRLYQVWSRNLVLAVYVGDGAFRGVRQKFDSRFLFTEYYGAEHAPLNSVRRIEDTGVDVPADIGLWESGSANYDDFTGRPCALIGDFPDQRGTWCYTDVGGGNPIAGTPVGATNDKLFRFLEAFPFECEDFMPYGFFPGEEVSS